MSNITHFIIIHHVCGFLLQALNSLLLAVLVSVAVLLVPISELLFYSTRLPTIFKFFVSSVSVTSMRSWAQVQEGALPCFLLRNIFATSFTVLVHFEVK